MPGVIAAGGPDTAAAGAAMLKQGGNAVDAAVAAAFASFIAEIGVVHLGGSGMAHVYDPSNGRSIVYDFFSNTPGLDQERPSEMDFEEVTIDFGATTQNFHLGRASVAVPGNIAGLCRMAANHGRLPFSTLMQPAIEMARDGLPIAPFQAETCKLLEPLYTHTASMRQIFAREDQILQSGERLFIPDLANTLMTLVDEGESMARTGHLAQAILADQVANGGLLTATDLQRYQVYELPSVRIPYGDFEILLPPPCSTGGVLTAFTLKLLSVFEIGQFQHGTLKHLRLLFEVMAATTRARKQWELISEENEPVLAVAQFLDDSFVQTYVEQVRDSLAGQHTVPAVAEPRGPNNTSHLSVIDDNGMAVSLTTTAGESAGYVVPGTGYIPNNIMGESDLHPKGFHSRPTGQRISTMMTPTIVLKNGRTRVVIGSGGSIRIRSAILQVLSNLLDFSMKLNDAVNTARVHLEHGILQCENGYDPVAVDKLEALGYPVNRWTKRSIYFGGAHSVSRTDNGRLVGAGDNRRGGSIAAM
jgi:gamma-glutamyltranspeptidase/glutathione hydrolase